MRSLHRQRHSHTECCQRHHRRRSHTDEHHLAKDRADFEKLTGKRRNQNPVEQTEVKLDIIFHLALERAECQGARVDGSRKFSALVTNLVADDESTKTPWSKVKLITCVRC